MRIIGNHLGKRYYIALVCKLIEAVATFLISVLISRGLGVTAKGEYSYIIEVVNILYILFGFGLGNTYATYRRKYGKRYQRDFVLLIYLQSALPILLLCLRHYMSGNEITYILLLTSVTTIWSSLSMIAVVENSIHRNIIVTVVNVLECIVLLLIFWYKKCTLSVALLLFAGTRGLTAVIIHAVYKITIFPLRMPEIPVAELYRLSALSMLMTMLITLNYKLDVVMLKQLSGSYNTGIYSVAVTISNLFLLVPDAFKEVLFSDSAKGAFKKSADHSITASLMISIGLMFLYAPLGRLLIRAFYGVDYLPSFGVSLILWIGVVPLILFKILQPVYISMGCQKQAVKYLLYSAIVNTAANALLIPRFEYYGAAIATTISYSLCGILFYLYYRAHIQDTTAYEI